MLKNVPSIAREFNHKSNKMNLRIPNVQTLQSCF